MSTHLKRIREKQKEQQEIFNISTSKTEQIYGKGIIKGLQIAADILNGKV